MKFLQVSIIILFFFLKQIPLLSQELEITEVPMNYDIVPSTIGQMTQDIEGNIWMTIADGLFKYDGSNLENFSPERQNSNSIVSNRLVRITSTSDGMI